MSLPDSPTAKEKHLGPRVAALAACLPWLLGLPLALLLNPWTIGLFRAEPLAPYYFRRTFLFTGICLAMGLAGLVGKALLVRTNGAKWLAGRPRHVGLLLATGLTCLLFAGVEGFLGLATAGFRYEPEMVDPDYLLRFRMKPNWSGLVAGAPATTNARGMRWADFPDTPTPDRKRVLVIGDSILFGFSTADEETIPARLAPFLAPDHELINAAIIGYDLQEEYYYAHELTELQPDEVLLGICLNDLSWTNASRLDGPPGDTATRPQKPTAWNRFIWWVRFHSAIVNLPKLWNDEEHGETPEEKNDYIQQCAWRLADDPAHREEQLAIVRAYLAGLVELFREHDATVRLVVFPYRFQYEPELAAQHPGHTAIQQDIRTVAAQLGIPVLDLYEPLGAEISRRGGDPGTMFFDINHFNAEGSRVCAEIIAREFFPSASPASGATP
ncbi:MAG: hypothetical protein PWP23_2175 [Candidatus Sumerlaeota bacterium]|nr:hypothetical protein [Candidatus Sumerlaeota bacterium]